MAASPNDSSRVEGNRRTTRIACGLCAVLLHRDDSAKAAQNSPMQTKQLIFSLVCVGLCVSGYASPPKSVTRWIPLYTFSPPAPYRVICLANHSFKVSVRLPGGIRITELTAPNIDPAAIGQRSRASADGVTKVSSFQCAACKQVVNCGRCALRRDALRSNSRAFDLTRYLCCRIHIGVVP